MAMRERGGAFDRKVTGAPVKFVGLGEKYDALEGFILSALCRAFWAWADLMSLIERVSRPLTKGCRRP